MLPALVTGGMTVLIGGLLWVAWRSPVDEEAEHSLSAEELEELRLIAVGRVGGRRRVKQWYRRENARDAVWSPPFNDRCPKCGSPIVAMATGLRGGAFRSPMAIARTTEERVAACGECGRAAYNGPTLKRRWIDEDAIAGRLGKSRR